MDKCNFGCPDGPYELLLGRRISINVAVRRIRWYRKASDVSRTMFLLSLDTQFMLTHSLLDLNSYETYDELVHLAVYLERPRQRRPTTGQRFLQKIVLSYSGLACKT